MAWDYVKTGYADSTVSLDDERFIALKIFETMKAINPIQCPVSLLDLKMAVTGRITANIIFELTIQRLVDSGYMKYDKGLKIELAKAELKDEYPYVRYDRSI